VRSYWKLFGEHVRNLGTPLPPAPQLALKVECPLSKWKVNSPLSTPNTTRKKPPHPLKLLIGCNEILFLKLAATIFGLD